jgi:sigma-E factor negative regulatory protein RseA
MNEKISALMDGELDHRQAEVAIKSLGIDDPSREDWDLYHVIGETMRGEAVGSALRRQKRADAIFAALAAEPTVFAPSLIKPPVERRTRLALAMAASVVTISAIGVVAMRQQYGQGAEVQRLEQVASQPVAPNRLAGTGVAGQEKVNDYLMVHRQFSNPSAFQPAALTRRESVPQAAAR